jgi:RNA polymerase sigma-70 factor (ECF subfamily)
MVANLPNRSRTIIPEDALGTLMATHSSHEVTQLLVAWNEGDQSALERLVPLVHAELYRLARRYMGRERPGHPLQPTALVNEAYLRLIEWKNVEWKNRAHFLGVSAQLMRRILVDDALKSLAKIDERKNRIVELRFFGGLSNAETAEVLGVAEVTVIREWNKAKAWLYRELSI